MSYSIIFLPVLFIVVAIVIGLIVLIYNLLYKGYANRKLQGKAGAFSFIEPLNFIMLIILVILTIFAFVINGKLNRIEDELRQEIQNNRTIMIQNQSSIGSLRSYIANIQAILQGMEEKDRWIMESSYDYVAFNPDDTVDAKVNFSLKTMSDNAQISLVITNKDTSEVTKVILDNDSSLVFSDTLNLSIEANYGIEVLSESSNGITKEKLMDIMVKSQFTDRLRHINASAGYVDGDTQGHYDFGFSFAYNGIEDLKIQKIEIRKYVDHAVEEYEIQNIAHIWDDGTYQQVKSEGTFELDKDLSIVIIVTDKSGNLYRSERIYIYDDREYNQ